MQDALGKYGDVFVGPAIKVGQVPWWVGRGEVGEMGAGVTSVVCQACDFSVSLPELSTFLYLVVMKMSCSLVLS